MIFKRENCILGVKVNDVAFVGLRLIVFFEYFYILKNIVIFGVYGFVRNLIYFREKIKKLFFLFFFLWCVILKIDLKDFKRGIKEVYYWVKVDFIK